MEGIGFTRRGQEGPLCHVGNVLCPDWGGANPGITFIRLTELCT